MNERMIQAIDITTLRDVLLTSGVKLSHVRNFIVDQIIGGDWKQNPLNMTVISPGGTSIEDGVIKFVTKRGLTVLDLVDENSSPEVKKVVAAVMNYSFLNS